MWKKVLLGCAIAVVLVIIVIPVALFFIGRAIAPSMQRPGALAKPAIVVGSGLMSTSVLTRTNDIGQITDIVCSKPSQIIAAGTKGAVDIETTSGKITSTVRWSETRGNVTVVTTSSGTCNFLNHGSWGNDSTLFDRTGKTLWSYGGSPGVDDAVAGDVNGDGKLEYAVGFNGGGGVHLLNSSGKKMWSYSDGNVWHVEMVDTDGDGRPEIVHSNAAGMLTVRNAAGKITMQNKAPSYFSHFSICHWPTHASNQYALQSDKDAIWVIDFTGNSVARLDAPNCGKLGSAKGLPISFKKGKSEYFAVLASFEHWQASVLYIYDSSKKVIYEEIMPGLFSSIASLPATGSHPGSLLVGGDNKILKYSIK